ncbi:DNA-directed RNA polymerase III subunit Rpc31, partial [Fasciolopsis buskii]
FKTKALIEYAFRSGPFYHPLPEVQEGIEFARGITDANESEENKPKDGPISTLHLILARKEITQWSSGRPMDKLYDPDSWYPKELSLLTRRSRRQLAAIRKRKRLAEQATCADLGDLISDQVIAQAVEATEVVDGDEPVGEVIEAASEADSDDARWNGEVNPDVTDPEELDEDELDNDYCQNYFDNGEADISDDNLGGDDDDGNTRYYD